MKMKKQLWNLHCGNNLFGKSVNEKWKKGFVFALDAAIAVVIALMFLMTAHYYVVKAEGSSLPELQTARVGSDLMSMLDNQDLFPFTDESDLENVEDELNEIAPGNYELRLEVDYKCECSDEISVPDCNELKESIICENNFVIGNEVSEDRFVASGQRFFVRIASVEYSGQEYPNTFYYGSVRYWIWLK